MKHTILIVTVLVLFWIVAGKAANTARPSFIAPVHWATAVCESRGNFQHEVHRSDGSYGGAWSWYVGTWNLDRRPKMPTRPWKATPRQQYVTYLRSVARHRHFGCLEGS
jgi:hypothetical protein